MLITFRYMSRDWVDIVVYVWLWIMFSRGWKSACSVSFLCQLQHESFVHEWTRLCASWLTLRCVEQMSAQRPIYVCRVKKSLFLWKHKMCVCVWVRVLCSYKHFSYFPSSFPPVLVCLVLVCVIVWIIKHLRAARGNVIFTKYHVNRSV